MKAKKQTTSPATLAGSAEAKRSAAMVLEVLSGTKTTIDASISTMESALGRRWLAARGLMVTTG